MTYYWKDRERALAYVRAGATAAAAAALISAPAPTVQRWCAAEGVFCQVELSKKSTGN